MSFLNPMVKDVLRLIDNSNLEEIKKGKLIETNNNNLKEMDNVSNKLLELKKISFQFISKESSVETKIKNVNFDIKKNSFFGIIGKSGSGKSTLLNIICGLIEPLSGKILYRDQNISQFKEKWLTKIGYVSQEVKLFDETILNNLTMFDNNYNDKEKINNVLKVLKLDTFVSSLPRKLETIIGSEGIELSVGQKQRIGIARALIRDPEILILDESTNSLDQKTEEEIIDFLIKLKKNKTIIFVTHDQELSKICDDIINLDHL